MCKSMAARLTLLAMLLLPLAGRAMAAAAPTPPVVTQPHPAADTRSACVDRLGLAFVGLGMEARDDLVCPLRWDGPGLGLELTYDRIAPRSRHQVRLAPTLGLLTNRYGHRAAGMGLRLTYSLLRRAARPDSRGTTYLGALVRWDTRPHVYVDWDEEHLYWFTAYELAPAAQHELRLSARQQLKLRFALPLLALVSRPPAHRQYKADDLLHPGFYISKPGERMQLASWNEYFAVTTGIDYELRLSRSWQLGFGYEFDYRRFMEPRAVRILSNSLSARIAHGI
jgi:hypothetical protein